MNSWQVEFLPEAKKDLDRIDNSPRKQILKAIDKVSVNPLPNTEGGYGKPLGNRAQTKLSGLLKIKPKGSKYRVVYQLDISITKMMIIIISVREDNTVYREAAKRLTK